jgi:hypothetical protein
MTSAHRSQQLEVEWKESFQFMHLFFGHIHGHSTGMFDADLTCTAGYGCAL